MNDSLLSRARESLLLQVADLRSPLPAAQQSGARVALTQCPVEAELASILTADEQQFWHAFLADADVFASVHLNTGAEFASVAQKYPQMLDSGRGWGDICFATADSLFDLLRDGNPAPFTVLFDDSNPRFHADAERQLRAQLVPGAVILFQVDGTHECHAFVAVPVARSDCILLVQSVGGIMRATLRILPTDDFVRLLIRLPASASTLFGYAIAGNDTKRVRMKTARRKRRIAPEILARAIAQLDDYDRRRLRAAFAQHQQWSEIDVNDPADEYFNVSTDTTKWPFYLVNPVTLQWQCAFRANDVPQSAPAIALRSGAICLQRQ